MFNFSRKTHTLIVVLAGILIGLGIGYLVFRTNEKKYQQVALAQAFSQVHAIREQGDNYQYINPLLAYDLPESLDFGQYADLEQKLNQLINSEKSQGNVDDVSVYFRGNQGHWVGINDDEGYYPASLLKVVVMIAFYQQAQNNPAILDNQLEYTTQIQDEAVSSEFSSTSSLKLNTSYKVSDLITGMIVNSDNGATYTLINALDGKDLNEVYANLGLKAPTDTNAYEISAKDYSLFFRILYNATYLDPEYSEKALSLLSQATFKDGLVAGIPAGTVVAHKFGEHVLTDSTGTASGVELHDCGLVYAKQLYLLCVMTRGQKVENLEKTIKDISSLVYTADEK